MSGDGELSGMAQFACMGRDFLDQFIKTENGPPSRNAISRFFSMRGKFKHTT